MTTRHTLDKRFILIIICSLLSFFLPVLYLKIDVQGRAVVGHLVPDIVIYGADVIGKDKRFGGIAWGILIQLWGNVLFLISILFNYWAYRRNRVFIVPRGISLLLVCAFPMWLMLFTAGIIDNSDNIATFLTPIPHVGMLLYVLIVYNVIFVMDKIGEDVARNMMLQS